jgi:hypothetical protein
MVVKGMRKCLQWVCMVMKIKEIQKGKTIWVYVKVITFPQLHLLDLHCLACIATYLTFVRLDDLEFESWQELGIFLLTNASRPVLGPTHPPIQWVPGTLFLGVNWPGREADHSTPSSVEIKNA